jgi:hypothetical protein
MAPALGCVSWAERGGGARSSAGQSARAGGREARKANVRARDRGRERIKCRHASGRAGSWAPPAPPLAARWRRAALGARARRRAFAASAPSDWARVVMTPPPRAAHARVAGVTRGARIAASRSTAPQGRRGWAVAVHTRPPGGGGGGAHLSTQRSVGAAARPSAVRGLWRQGECRGLRRARMRERGDKAGGPRPPQPRPRGTKTPSRRARLTGQGAGSNSGPPPHADDAPAVARVLPGGAFARHHLQPGVGRARARGLAQVLATRRALSPGRPHLGARRGRLLLLRADWLAWLSTTRPSVAAVLRSRALDRVPR